MSEQTFGRVQQLLGATAHRFRDRLGGRILRHTKADITVNVYMRPIEEGVKQTLDAIYAELTAGSKLVAVS